MNLSKIKFKDMEHEKWFKAFIEKGKVAEWDVERIPLLYLIAMCIDTREHANDLYDFKHGCIKIDGLNHGWHTGGSKKITKLAFNLFNNFLGEDGEKEDFGPLELFSLDEYRDFMIYAVQLRFND